MGRRSNKAAVKRRATLKRKMATETITSSSAPDNPTDHDQVLQELQKPELLDPLASNLNIVDDGQRPSTSSASAAGPVKNNGKRVRFDLEPTFYENSDESSTEPEKSEDDEDDEVQEILLHPAYNRFVDGTLAQHREISSIFAQSFDDGTKVVEELLRDNRRLNLKVEELQMENERLATTQVEMEGKHQEEVHSLRQQLLEERRRLMVIRGIVLDGEEEDGNDSD